MKKSKVIITSLLWASVVMWMGVIFCLSAQASDESAQLSGGLLAKISELFGAIISEHMLRKLAHMLEYSLLGALCVTAFRASSADYSPVLAFLLCVFYSVTDETHQLFVPGRSGSVYDMLVDSSGALIGIAVTCFTVYLFKRFKRTNFS